MEIEIELNVTLTPALAQKVRESFSKRFELVSFKAPGKYSLRTDVVADSVRTIDEAIQNYLSSMEPLASLFVQASGVLRVGAFFSEGEAAAFSVLLSSKTVQMLANHQFAIDVTCYPCS